MNNIELFTLIFVIATYVLLIICLVKINREEKNTSSDNNLLIKLPCDIGDKLYAVTKGPCGNWTILELTVKEFVYRRYKFPRIEIYFEDVSGFDTCLFDGTLNDDVFLNKKDAYKELIKKKEGD